VVRGRALGHQYVLEPGETVVGNALNGAKGLDLADQEGTSPRKMAARQAALTSAAGELTIRDLDSPGGTFVNQQRLLAGQTRRLVPGDVIQLGGVQIKVKESGATASAAPAAETRKAPVPAAKVTHSAPKPAAPATPGRLTTPFSFAGGSQCRSWDDFLVLAAQDWPALRDELTSGRLADYLRRIGRNDMVPLAGSSRSPDDQLDDWLARVPTTGSSAPELDVHPEKLVVRAATGGGITRQTLRLTNVGYRLLRCSARVEPAGTSWLRLRPEHIHSFATIDHTDVPVEVELPERINGPLVGHVVIDGNGGTRRIEVRIERPTEQVVIPDSAGALAPASPLWKEELGRTVGRVRPITRLAIGCAAAAGLRLLVSLFGGVASGDGSSSAYGPRLASLAIVLVALGMLAGLVLARRRSEWRDLPAAVFAGGSLGLLAAAIWFALLQSVERTLGSWSNATWAIGVTSGALGVLLALSSLFFFPFRSEEPEVAR
jgi:hypothetical protein